MKSITMNHYSISDLSIGHKESFTTEITSEMFDKFREITGDINPLHNDESFAKCLGYRGGGGLWHAHCIVFIDFSRCLPAG